jgi:hypothetical protein
MRAYAIAPKDPLNTLALGIALLHASMQRKVDNRHLQIMQVSATDWCLTYFTYTFTGNDVYI